MRVLDRFKLSDNSESAAGYAGKAGFICSFRLLARTRRRTRPQFTESPAGTRARPFRKGVPKIPF